MSPNAGASDRDPSAVRKVGEVSPESLLTDPHTRLVFWFGAILASLAALGLFFSATLEERAADADAQSLLETVQRQQLGSRTESQVGLERILTLRARAAEADAGALRRSAAEARARGDVERANDLEREAQVAAQVAKRRLESSYTGMFGTVTEEGAFDAATLRRILTLDEPVVSSYDPSEDARAADRLRRRSDGVAFAVVTLSLCFVLLVYAQAGHARSRQTRHRPSTPLTPSAVWRAQIALAVVMTVAAAVGGALWGVGIIGPG